MRVLKVKSHDLKRLSFDDVKTEFTVPIQTSYFSEDRAPKILHFNWIGPYKGITKRRLEPSVDLANRLQPELVCLWVSDLDLFKESNVNTLFNSEWIQNNQTWLVLPFDYILWKYNDGVKSKYAVETLRKEPRWKAKIILELIKSNYINAADIIRVMNMMCYGGAYFDFGKAFETRKKLTSFWKCKNGVRWHLKEIKEKTIEFNSDMFVVAPKHKNAKQFGQVLEKINKELEERKWPLQMGGEHIDNRWYMNYTSYVMGTSVILKNFIDKAKGGREKLFNNQRRYFDHMTQGATPWHYDPDKLLEYYKGYEFKQYDTHKWMKKNHGDLQKNFVKDPDNHYDKYIEQLEKCDEYKQENKPYKELVRRYRDLYIPEYNEEENVDKLGDVLKEIKKYITIAYALRLHDSEKKFDWKHSTFFDRETRKVGKKVRGIVPTFINDVVDGLMETKPMK
jgi:hypothetical protein